MHLRINSLYVLCVAFLITYYPVWKSLIHVWTHNDNYSHGFAIVPLSLFIIWRQRDEILRVISIGKQSGLVIVIFSLLIYLFAQTGEIQTLAPLSMIFFVAGVILYLWGYPLLKMMAFPLILLLLMIPIPAQLMAAVTIPLQLLVTKITGIMADKLGIPIYIQGNLIHIPNQIFEVVEACSGLRSMMTLVTLGAFMGYFTLDFFWQRIILILSSLPIAIAVNSIRVLAMVTFSFYFDVDLLQGYPHTFFGMGIFFIALCLFFGVQKFLVKWRISTN